MIFVCNFSLTETILQIQRTRFELTETRLEIMFIWLVCLLKVNKVDTTVPCEKDHIAYF